jgi:DNA polymerase-3 subunit epsilon
MSRTVQNIIFSEEEIKILLKLFPKGVVSFDLETTGLSPLIDKIIEIAAVKITSEGKIETFHTLVNPLIPIPQYTIQYHQIYDEMVANAPSLKKPLRDFVEFYGSLPLIGHNAQFDAGFLIKSLHYHQYEISLSSVFDSCLLARQIYKKSDDPNVQLPQSFKLSNLAHFFKIDFTHHQALDDAYVSLKVFAQCLLKLPDPNHKFISQKCFVYKINQFAKAPEDLPPKFELLKKHLPEKKLIYIQYKGGTHGDKLRPVIPIALLPMPAGPVLYAECGITKLNKNFLLKKIKRVSELAD